MKIDNTPEHKYILIDTSVKPPYAFIRSATLTEYEAQTKNRAFAMNRVNKRYVLEKDWK